MENNIRLARVALSALGLSYLILTLLIITIKKLFLSNSTIFILRCIFMFAIVTMTSMIHRAYQKRSANLIFWVMLLYGAIITLA